MSGSLPDDAKGTQVGSLSSHPSRGASAVPAREIARRVSAASRSFRFRAASGRRYSWASHTSMPIARGK
jgi:hypothetical protein